MEKTETAKREPVKFTPAMVNQVNRMQAQLNQELKRYLQACMDAMPLDGTYTPDFAQMAFVPVEEKGKPEKE